MATTSRLSSGLHSAEELARPRNEISVRSGIAAGWTATARPSDAIGICMGAQEPRRRQRYGATVMGTGRICISGTIAAAAITLPGWCGIVVYMISACSTSHKRCYSASGRLAGHQAATSAAEEQRDHRKSIPPATSQVLSVNEHTRQWWRHNNTGAGRAQFRVIPDAAALVCPSIVRWDRMRRLGSALHVQACCHPAAMSEHSMSPAEPTTALNRE
jgi:hypothetical protein